MEPNNTRAQEELIDDTQAEDLSIEEVAQVLGKGKIATKVMLHRARRKLSTFSDQLKDNYENPA